MGYGMDRSASVGSLMGFIIGGAIIGGVALHKICGVSDTMAAVISAVIGIPVAVLVYILCMREFRKQDDRRHGHGR